MNLACGEDFVGIGGNEAEMLTNTEIKELIFVLLDSRKKLLWLISQNPITNTERKLIEFSEQLLLKTNQFLEEFNIELPA